MKEDVAKQFRDVLEDLIAQYVLPILNKWGKPSLVSFINVAELTSQDASGSAWLEHASDFCHGLRKVEDTKACTQA